MVQVLLIDDDDEVRETIREMLEFQGVEVETAKDGRGGMKRLADGSFDLVITDVLMPQMDGIEVTLEIRKLHPSVKILAISGGSRLSADDCLKAAKALGADVVLAKPFGMEQLSGAIKAALAAEPQ